MCRLPWNRQAKQHYSTRGQSVVEFALLAPILLLMVAAAVDLGNAFQTWITMTNAAREGARKAIVTADTSLVCSRVQQALANDNISVSCGNVSLTYPAYIGADVCVGGSPVAGCPVRVTATYAMPTLLGGVLGITTITITGSMDMVYFG